MSDELTDLPVPGGATEPETSPARRKPPIMKIVWLLVLVAALGFGGRWGYEYYLRLSHEQSTDDAYVTASITQVAPQVTGTVTQVLVEDNQDVKAGQLLVVLDDRDFQVAAQQAQANLEAAVAQAQAAGATVQLTRETGSAQIAQAQGVLEQAQTGIGTARAQVGGTEATLAKSAAAVREAQSNITTAQTGVEAAKANRQQAQAAVAAAGTVVATARSAVKAAETGVVAAKAEVEKAQDDLQRYQTLLEQSAISKQTVEHARTAVRLAQAGLDNAQQQVQIAKDNVEARLADQDVARQRAAAADAAVAQAQAQLATAQDHSGVVKTDIAAAEAQRSVATESVKQARAKRTQAVGQLAQARTVPTQVAVGASNQAQALAKIDQARAALANAQTQLARTRIVSPLDGRISKKNVSVGGLVQPGTPLMAIVQAGPMWVVANFKETQLKGMTPGQPARITVDALGGITLHGTVRSLSPATGATFALLPPENASGNFTKIVQRIPVKIVLDEAGQDLSVLRGGMSVVATVETR